jgi:hypothetical protein
MHPTSLELERLSIRAIERAIQSQPELAIQAATRLGWTVIPSHDRKVDR